MQMVGLELDMVVSRSLLLMVFFGQINFCWIGEKI